MSHPGLRPTCRRDTQDLDIPPPPRRPSTSPRMVAGPVMRTSDTPHAVPLPSLRPRCPERRATKRSWTANLKKSENGSYQQNINLSTINRNITPQNREQIFQTRFLASSRSRTRKTSRQARTQPNTQSSSVDESVFSRLDSWPSLRPPNTTILDPHYMQSSRRTNVQMSRKTLSVQVVAVLR